MKSFFLVLFVALLLSHVGCGGEEGAGVSLRLTNPQNIAVPFHGYYQLSTAIDSVLMEGYTNDEYNFTLSSGESIEGWVRKDTTDTVDTLHCQVFVNGEEELSLKTTSMDEVIQFDITAQ